MQATSPLSAPAALSAHTLVHPTALRLAAIDLDGTLLGPDRRISPENRHAVAALRTLGIEPVIATGRHYESARPYIESLADVRWVVTAQGAEVSDRDRRQVLERRHLAPRLAALALDAADRAGADSLVYATGGIFTHQTKRAAHAHYHTLSGLDPIQVDRADLSRLDVFKVLWLDTPDRLNAVMDAPAPDPGLVKVRTHERIIEFVPASVSKASGLATLATHLGLAASEVAAFGDAENDLSMFHWAGCAVAMAHGWPAALAAADHVSPPGPPETAFARAVHALWGITPPRA